MERQQSIEAQRRRSLDGPEGTMHIAPWNEVARGAPTNMPRQPVSREIVVELSNANATIAANTVSWQVASPSIGLLKPGSTVQLVSVVASNQGSAPLEWGVSGFNTWRFTSGSDGFALRGYLANTGSLLYTPNSGSVPIAATLQDLDLFSSGRRVTLHLLTPGAAFTTNDTYRLTLLISEP